MSGVWLGHDGDKVIKFGVNAQGGALFFLRWLKQTIGWDVAHHFFPPLECDYDWIHMWTSGGVSSHPTWLFSIVLKLCHCSTTMKTGPLVETCKLKDKAATLQSVVYHHSPGCCLIVVDGKKLYLVSEESKENQILYKALYFPLVDEHGYCMRGVCIFFLKFQNGSHIKEIQNLFLRKELLHEDEIAVVPLQ